MRHGNLVKSPSPFKQGSRENDREGDELGLDKERMAFVCQNHPLTRKQNFHVYTQPAN